MVPFWVSNARAGVEREHLVFIAVDTNMYDSMAFGTHYSTYYYESDETAKKRYGEKLQKVGVYVCVCAYGES